jgi:hypothetical protein
LFSELRIVGGDHGSSIEMQHPSPLPIIFKGLEKEARNVLHVYAGDAARAALEPVGRSGQAT